jgi:hypothetical protein
MTHIQVLSALSGVQIGDHTLLATDDGDGRGDDTEGLPKATECCMMQLRGGLEPLVPVQ